MSKQHHIRWKSSDLQELERVVRNFNAKLQRLEKKNPELKKVLPDKVSARQLKELINTRQDLKRELNSLKRFSKRGSEEIIEYGDYNIKVTKWQKNEINRRVAIINRRRKQRKEEIESLEMTSRGQSLGYTKGQFGMGRLEDLEFLPLKGLTPGMSQYDLQAKWRNVRKQSQSDFILKGDYQWRDNYISSLEQNYNPNDVKDIIEKINQMDINDFILKMRSEVGSFETSYPPNAEEYAKYLESLRATWLPNKN